MAYTAKQWAAIQASLPSEDRTSYEDYLRASGLEQFRTAEAETAAAKPTDIQGIIQGVNMKEFYSSFNPNPKASQVSRTDSAAAAAANAAAISAEDIYYTVKVGNTGKTQAQLDAAKNAADTAAGINASYSGIGITSTVDPVTGRVVTINNSAAKLAADKAAADAKAAAEAKAAADLAAAKAAADKAAAEAAIAAAKSAAELTAAKNALIAANAAAAAAAQAAADAVRNAATAATANAANANTNINVTGNTVIPGAGTTAADIAAKAAAESAKLAQRESTIKILTDRFARYNLGGLANKIRALAIDGANEATITIDLMETDEYKQRFKANDARLKAGLQVLNPAEYLNLEDGYRQVLRAYGLKQFDTDDYVSQFIANDVSAAELSNRVVTAVQRVQNADPAISKQLRDYYGVGQADLVAYVLDPNQQFQKIERQVAASEIGVAAARQGLQAGVSVAEQLAAQGVTQAEAQKGYATIADILPTAEKLSSIYGTTLDGYGQTEAEQEVFNSLASAQRKRQKLTQREIASFSGAAGTNKTSLTTPSVGQF
jgi:hypothetical protein